MHAQPTLSHLVCQISSDSYRCSLSSSLPFSWLVIQPLFILPSPPCADHDGSGFRARGDQTVPTARADSRCRDLGLLSRRERLPDRLEEQLQVSIPQTTQPPLLKALQQNVHLLRDLLLQHQPASQKEGPAHDSSPQQRHWL